MKPRTLLMQFVIAGAIGAVGIACNDGTTAPTVHQKTEALTAATATGLPVDTASAVKPVTTDALKTLPSPGPARRATAAERQMIEAAIAAQRATPRSFKD